nr:serine/arginine repetitive matrix protein 1-like isoform X1 [Rhipicephalus microplus]XP_037274560.1 serine/arginine repetitive matrix protein 1-like isoform X1 [Rhipicephalus microplus]
MSERQHHGRQQHRRPSEDAGGRKLKRPKKEPAASSPARAPTSSTTSARSARRPSEPVKAAATSARRNSKSKAQPPPKPQPKRKPEPPPARHNGERVVCKRRAGVRRSQGILGLCDSFSSQCDLRGSRSASAVMPPGAGGGARTVEPVPSPGPNLRPKFPAFLASVAAAEDWPTARVQRVASLNAMAKVHILYENESRPAIVEADDAQEDCKALVPLRTDHLRSPSPPPPQSSPPQSPPPSSPPAPIVVTRRKKKAIVARKVIKRKRDVLDADVEIIDTRQCRRMASLNAQAIMAASYSRERSSRKFDKESPSSFSSSSSSSSSSTSSAASCELKVVHHHHQQEIVVCSVQTKTVHKTVQEKAEVPVLPSAPKGPHGDVVVRRPRKNDAKAGSSTAADGAASSSSVAVSEYREVVRINTTKEMAVKDERREKEGVTHLYHYHTKATCMQMQTTYNGPPSPVPSHPAVLGPQAPGYDRGLLSECAWYYGPPSYPPALTGPPPMAAAAALMPPPTASASSAPGPPAYGVNHVMPMSGAPMHRHYGSAFTVPHYGHAVPYPQAEYMPGYYQPAGPTIQPPPHDQCLIHKPVPYHPQHRPAPVPLPPPPPGGFSSSHCASPLCPPPPPPHCYSEHMPCSPPPAPQGSAASGPAPPQAYPPYRPGPYHTQPSFQAPPSASSSSSTSSQVSSSSVAPPPAPQPQSTTDSYQMSTTAPAAAVPKSEPVTPPETKSPSQGNDFLDASKAAGKDGGANGESRTTPFQPEAQLSVAEPLVLTKNAPKPSSVKTATTTLQPETNIVAVEPVVPVKKRPRSMEKQIKSGTVMAQQRLGRASSMEERTGDKKGSSAKLVKRSFTKSGDTDKVCLPASKNGIKKSLPNHVAAVRITEKKRQRLSVGPETDAPPAEKEPSETSEKVPSSTFIAPVHAASKESAVTTNAVTNDSEGVVSEHAVSPLPPSQTKVRKENGSATSHSSVATTKKVQLSSATSAVVPKNSSLLQASKTATVVLPPRLLLSSNNKRPQRRKFAHGWSWDGEPFQKVLVMNNEDAPRYRLCFPAMRHMEGDVIRVRDCVLLRSGTRKIDLPFVAKVAALWENEDDGEMMMSLLWYYRPEHTDQGRKSHHMEDEIFASKHRDANSVACIEDKCYVLTFAEYCRYRAKAKMLEEGVRQPAPVVPDQESGYPRHDRLPPGRMDPQMVFFCRRVYDFRQKRILKNPS